MLDGAALVPILAQLLAGHLQLGEAQDQQDLDDGFDVIIVQNRFGLTLRLTLQVYRTADCAVIKECTYSPTFQFAGSDMQCLCRSTILLCPGRLICGCALLCDARLAG